VISIYILLISMSMLFSDTRNSPSLMATFGNSSPANNFESYGDQGFTFKVVYERPLPNYKNLRYNFGWQNVSFAEYLIENDSWSGLQIREGEKANLFDIGLKFIFNDGMIGNGLFRPYLNSSVGYSFFRQYTEYDYPDTFASECEEFLALLFNILTGDDCDVVTNDNINTITNSRMSSSFFTLDLGTSFAFNKNAMYSIEFGVRYLMIGKIKSTDWSNWNWQNMEDDESFNQVIGRRIGADYKSIYLGFSIFFGDEKSRSNRKDRKKRNKKDRYI